VIDDPRELSRDELKAGKGVGINHGHLSDQVTAEGPINQ
jgi:hypothetical protein